MEQKYSVEVNNIKYDICVERINGVTEKSSESINIDSAQMSLDTIRSEYEHCIARSEKLDNKIYILLTICAFMFAFSTSTITQIKNFSMPSTIKEECMLITYMILVALITILFIYLLCKLIKILEGIKIKRLDPEDIFKGDLFAEHPKTSARVIGMIYVDALTENNLVLEKRFQEYNRCSKILIPIVILSLITSLIGNFL